MAFTDVFIKRPVLSCTISLLLLVIGIISFLKLTIREFPKIDLSTVTVMTSYPGASAEMMEGFVTSPIENVLSGIDGIDYMRSSSTQGSSGVRIVLKSGYDINQAAIDVSNKISSIRSQLPKEIEDPVVHKSDPNAQPIVWLTFSSQTKNLEDVTDHLLRVVQPQLQAVPGVSEAMVLGEREYAMRIWLDPYRMAAHGVTARDVANALQANNVQAAAGQIRENEQQFDVYGSTDLKTPAQFNQMMIYNKGGHIVRIRDIGKAQLGNTDEPFAAKIKGIPSIFIGVIAKSDANPLDVSKGVTALFPSIQQHLPDGISGEIMYDSSQFISASLHDVEHTIIEASLLVFIVIFLMLGSVRAILIPLVTIPLSLIGAFAIMLALGYSINVLTLLAFVLAIGLVVDDAIVVLENIHRHLAEGLSPKEAAIAGAREISFAVISITLTLAAVYAPIGFMEGITGKLFTEFAFTLAGAVIISGFIALTLSPMMCSQIYREHENLDAGLPGKVHHLFEKVRMVYEHILKLTFKLRYLILGIALLIYLSCYLLFLFIPQELAPNEDHGALLSVARGPSTSTLQYMETHTDKMAKIFNSIPNIQNYGIVDGHPDGVNSAFGLILLKPWNERKASAEDIKNQLMPLLWSIPGIEAFPGDFPSLPTSGDADMTPVYIVLKTTRDYNYLQTEALKFLQATNQTGLIYNPDISLKFDQPQIYVDIHRDVAADLGIPMSEIADTLNISLAQPITTRFNMEGRNYEVLPQLYSSYRNVPSAINNLQVRTLNGELIPLSNVVAIKERIVPRSLEHFQQLRALSFTAMLAPGHTLGEVLTKLSTLAEKTLPKDIEIDYAGQSRQFIDSSNSMLQTLIFALIFIYLILSAQFESFIDPLIVMLSVPLAAAGALLVLYLSGGTMNIYTEIGFVTLIGLVSKNGILIVEFANQQQILHGLSPHEAILKAAAIRLRPILMTTSSILLGTLPLVLASGAGAVSRRELGIVIMAGMGIGTFFTLFVIPTAYYLFSRKKQ